MTESFADLFEQSLTNTQLQPGTIVNGTVVGITSESVIADGGLKSEGVIPKSQFIGVDRKIEAVFHGAIVSCSPPSWPAAPQVHAAWTRWAG